MAYENDLRLELHFGADLLEGDTLHVLQDVLTRRAPKVAASLEVHAFERDPGRILVDMSAPGSLRMAIETRGTARGETYSALMERDPSPLPPRRFGMVFLRGRGPGTRGLDLAVQFDTVSPVRPSGTQWLWSNSIQATVSSARIHGAVRQDWIFDLVRDIIGQTPCVWGAAYVNAEFHDSNMHDDRDGMWALGRDVAAALPGLYWLNVFGAPYVELIGRDRLLAAPADLLESHDAQVILRAYPDAESWAASQASKGAIVEALGPEYFFDRDAPDRANRAPDFGLPALQPTRVLRVFFDGETFNELP